MITHDYAQAWSDLAESFENNQPDILSGYFTGEAKRRLSQRLSEQNESGLRTRYVDRGHRVKGIFYSLDGGEMQLEDQVQLEVQIFDGDRKIYEAESLQTYLVLMTPGSDRWYVRLLESVSPST